MYTREMQVIGALDDAMASDTVSDIRDKTEGILRETIETWKETAAMNMRVGAKQGATATLIATWVGAGIGQFAAGKEGIMWGSIIGSLTPLTYPLFKGMATK